MTWSGAVRGVTGTTDPDPDPWKKVPDHNEGDGGCTAGAGTASMNCTAIMNCTASTSCTANLQLLLLLRVHQVQGPPGACSRCWH
jgi:hypothetical protein